MHRSQTCPAVLLVLSLLLAMTDMRAGDAETQAKLKGALANFQAVTPEILLDPKNADLLQALRSMAANPRQTAARVPLIRLGDETVIQSCLEQLSADRPKSAIAQLEMAANPKVIPLLVPHFKKEESTDPMVVSYDLVKMPPSMNAALIVKRIIVDSGVFNPDVKLWAEALPSYLPGLRTGVRSWWETNKVALLREDYAAVVVP